MVERVIATRLTAQVSNYVANMDAAAKSTRKVSDTLAGQKAASIEAAKAQGEASQKIGAGMLAIGAVAAVGVGLAVKAFADFDQKMSNVRAATNESTENMDLLRAAAVKAGQDTAFSAGEAADAVTELAKAGVATKDILGGGLAGALSLAAAGEISVGRAAEIAATAMTQFGLAGSKVPHIADLLASGANKAQGGVEDLSGALSQGGLVAASTGLTIEETVGTLSAFASAGLLGSDAGTSFKSMLQRLTPVSAESKEEMDRLGISAYDAQGQFIGMEKFAGNLQTAMKDLTPEQRNASQAIIFGSDAVRASNILYEQGAEGIGKWISEVDDSGAAARTAAIKLDNLNGDLQILRGSFDTALIQSGGGANDALRNLTQTATGLINMVAGLPAPVVNAGLALGGLVTIVALAGGTALIAVPKVVAFKASLSALDISGRRAGIGVAKLSGGLAAAGIAFSLFAEYQANAAATAAEFKGSLDASTGAVTNYTRELVAKKLAESGAFDAAKEAGISQKELTDKVIEGGDALKDVQKTLSGKNTIASFFDFSAAGGIAAGNAQSAIRDVSNGLVRSEKDWKNQAAAAEGSAESVEAATAANKAATQAIAEVSEEQAKYLAGIAEQDAAFISLGGAYDTIIQKNRETAESTASSTEDSSDSWETYYDGFTVGLDNYLAELQSQVDAQNAWESNMVMLSGRVSKGVLDELANMGPEGADLVADLVNASSDELGKLEELYGERAADATGAFASKLTESALVINAASAQLGQDAANEIAGKLASGTSTVQQIMTDYGISISSINPVVNVTANTDAAYASLEALAARARAMQDVIMPMGDGSEGRGLGIMKNAEGGTITGPGTGTSDSILSWVSTGEEITKATMADKHRPLLKAINSDRVSDYLRTAPKFSRGGTAGGPTYVPASQFAGGNSSSVTNRTVQQTWNVTSNGEDPSALAAKIDGRVNWSMRRLS